MGAVTDLTTALLDPILAADPAGPRITYYDDATGERIELSAVTLANWAAKTANFLSDEFALVPGARVSVLLPAHWQTAAVLLGCWSAKLTVTDAPGPVEVLFVAADRVDEAAGWPAGERYALALDPFALPMRQVPAGYADFVTAVRGHGDHFTLYPEGGEGDAALLARATARATELGLTQGDRLLVDVTTHPDPVDWLLTPLTAGASVVACAHPDPTRLASRAETEKTTHTLP